MPFDPSDDLQQQATLDRLTRRNAHLIVTALKVGEQPNMRAMLTMVSDYLSDDQAFAELIQNTLAGRNAFRELLDKLALDQGEKQAEREMANAPRRRQQQAAESRAEQARWQAQMS